MGGKPHGYFNSKHGRRSYVAQPGAAVASKPSNRSVDESAINGRLVDAAFQGSSALSLAMSRNVPE